MVLHQLEPLHLLRGKVDRAGVAAEGPLLEVIVHLVGEGLKAVRLPHLEPHQGHQVGQLAHSTGLLHLLRLLNGVAVPQPLQGDPFLPQLLIQGFQLFQNHGPVLIGLAVQDAQSDDLVLVLLDKVTEGLDHPLGGLLFLGVESGEEHRVRVGVVDDLLVAAADIFDKIPHLRAAEGSSRLGHCLLLDGLHLLRGRLLCVEFLPSRGGEHILVKGVQQLLRQFVGGQAHHLRKLLPLAGRHLTVQADDPSGQGGEGIFVPGSQRHIQHQFFQRDRGLALQDTGVRLLGGGDPHSVHNDKVVLILCGRGRDLL